MDEAELAAAVRAFWEAYWYAHTGRRDGSPLDAYPDLSAEELLALTAGVEAVEAYIAALP